MNERVHCGKCGMSFLVRKTPGKVERSRCPECGRAFQHGHNSNRAGANWAAVYVEPPPAANPNDAHVGKWP